MSIFGSAKSLRVRDNDAISANVSIVPRIKLSPESDDNQPGKKSKLCKFLKRAIIGIGSIVAFYGLLALLIDSQTSKDSGSGKENDLAPDENDSGCGADSFMIRDGVCDEAANFKTCLFDGGDCCLDVHDKDTSLCRDCTCRLAVDQDWIFESFERLGVKKLKPSGFPQLMLSLTHVATDVLTEDTCKTLCLDETMDSNVNGWSYDIENRLCSCAWLKSSDCNIDDHLLDSGFESRAYIQTTKTLDCGCLLTDTTYIFNQEAFALENIFIEEHNHNVLSSWHCKQACIDLKACKLFSWGIQDQVCLLLTEESGLEIQLGGTNHDEWYQSHAHCNVSLDVQGYDVNLPLKTSQGWITSQPGCNSTAMEASTTDSPATNGTWTVLDTGIQVMFINKTTEYFNALQDCLDNGGRLFEPRNATDLDLVQEKALELGIVDFWIGVTDNFDDDNYVYMSDSTPLAVSANIIGEVYYKEVYVTVDTVTGNWHDNDHYREEHPYVCELAKGPNFGLHELSSGKEVFFGYSHITLDEAMCYCFKKGGQIFEPKTLNERLEIELLSRKVRLGEGYWIGISDRIEEGSFKYLSNGLSVPEEVLSWMDYEPDDVNYQWIFQGNYDYYDVDIVFQDLIEVVTLTEIPPGWMDISIASIHPQTVCEIV